MKEFMNYEQKIKELCKNKIYEYMDLLNVLYKTGAEEILNSGLAAPVEAIAYIQYCWIQTKGKPYSELEKVLNPALKYIDTINEKDKFEMNIRTFFFIQLLNERENMPRLRWLFEYLHQNYGNTLSKVKKLLKDIEEGEAICSDFKEQNNCKCSITLISNLVWPHLLFNMSLMKDIKIHPELLSTNKKFEELYMSKFKHRQIMFLPLFGNVEVLERTQGVARIINVNPLQASILLLFNKSESCDIKNIITKLGIDSDIFQKVISPFIPDFFDCTKEKLSLVKSGGGYSKNYNISDSSTNVFSESKYYVSFSNNEIFSSTAKTEEEKYSALKIEEAHTSLIQSCIIRVMKKVLTSNFANLRKAVEELIKDQFIIKDSEFNSSINKLMAKSFISFDDYENYKYIE